jgi:hypothetical protein
VSAVRVCRCPITHAFVSHIKLLPGTGDANDFLVGLSLGSRCGRDAGFAEGGLLCRVRRPSRLKRRQTIVRFFLIDLVS